jgi:hypothetical protein
MLKKSTEIPKEINPTGFKRFFEVFKVSASDPVRLGMQRA